MGMLFCLKFRTLKADGDLQVNNRDQKESKIKVKRESKLKLKIKRPWRDNGTWLVLSRFALTTASYGLDKDNWQ